MTLIDLGEFKIRFDPKEVRISVDGEIIDIGARSKEDNQTVYSTEEVLEMINRYRPKKK